MLHYLLGALAEEELLPFIANKDFNHDDLDLDSLKTDKTAGNVNMSIDVYTHNLLL